MLNFIVRRLIQIPVVMLVLSLMVVGLTQMLTPEQRAAPYIRSEQQAARLEQIIEERGLRDPFPVQYSRWFVKTISGDLGFSKASGKDVLDTIRERLPATIELTIITAIPILLLSIWLGTLSALHKDKLIDQVLRVMTIIAYSLPTFVLGILMLAIFYAYLGWLPGAGQLSIVNQFAIGDLRRYTGMLSVDAMLNGRWDIAWDVIRHMLLPAATLTIVSSASIIKVMRNNMLEALTSDYVRTARAKGLSPRIVNNKHARRNALLSIVTLGGFLIIGLLGGSLITETIFAFPGIGQWVVQAALQIDLAAVLGFALLSALIVVVVSTLVDILYGVIDPRVRFD
ncbi:ABC transporter permease [Deinococcus deserti]|uniref:Putative peptide/oligopeptide/nickel ABC transporter, permease component n=1 Tax=Deinococcus deserti (strain DSM 17065 / CIP 109153 / LMG 22923 / VCD115) TaxID=546414 RepID=C1CXI6_DEIDV|nr:ABC transporter permease [Deinococcus deserti]ACO46903.1 putative peptide/oligopeptide/nickel ABC transporter, permease component [Deinococcus deserti VCD115]